jgi:hypothetical protein
MGCNLGGVALSSTLLFNNCSFSPSVIAILSDGGVGLSSGSFVMQPGTYQVEFYAQSVMGCGASVNLTENNGILVQVISTGVFQCAGPFPNPNPVGNMAWTSLIPIPPNVTMTLQFALQPNSGVSFNGGTLIFLKLQ